MEMALVLPVLLLIVFAIIEFGSAWKAYQVVTNASREGVRRAVMPAGNPDAPTDEQSVRQIVKNVMEAGGLAYDDAYVSLTCEGNAGLCPEGRGREEKVQIDYPYSFVLMGPLVDYACRGIGCDGSAYGTVTLTTSSVMRQE